MDRLQKDFWKSAAFFITGLILFIVTIMLGTNLATASDATPELIAQGKTLFNSKEGLGVKFACILCHKGNKALKKADMEKLGDGLPDMINKYLTTKSKGKALAKDSQEMKALVAYILNEHSV